MLLAFILFSCEAFYRYVIHFDSWWLLSNGKASARPLLCLSTVCVGQELCSVSPSVTSTVSRFSVVRINPVNLTIACVLSQMIRTEQEGYTNT